MQGTLVRTPSSGGIQWYLYLDPEYKTGLTCAVSFGSKTESMVHLCDVIQRIREHGTVRALSLQELHGMTLTHTARDETQHTILRTTLTHVRELRVRRSDSDGRGGYTWSVTFLDYVGDVPALVADNDLTSYSTTISVAEEVKGNQLGGTFSLELDGFVTDDLPYDVSAEDLEVALEDLGNVGTVGISRYASRFVMLMLYALRSGSPTRTGSVLP